MTIHENPFAEPNEGPRPERRSAWVADTTPLGGLASREGTSDDVPVTPPVEKVDWGRGSLTGPDDFDYAAFHAGEEPPRDAGDDTAPDVSPEYPGDDTDLAWPSDDEEPFGSADLDLTLPAEYAEEHAPSAAAPAAPAPENDAELEGPFAIEAPPRDVEAAEAVAFEETGPVVDEVALAPEPTTAPQPDEASPADSEDAGVPEPLAPADPAAALDSWASLFGGEQAAVPVELELQQDLDVAQEAAPQLPAPFEDADLPAELPGTSEGDHGEAVVGHHAATDLPSPAVNAELPASPDDEPAPAADPTQIWKEALEQRRLRRTSATEASAAAERQSEEELALIYRYAHYERLQDLVSAILAASQQGDPDVQTRVNKMVLTRDPVLDAAQRREYQSVLLPLLHQAGRHQELSDARDVQAAFDMAYDERIGLGPLGPLWRDDDVTEIMVTGPYKVTCERNGELINVPVRFRDLQHLLRLAKQMAQQVDDRLLSRTSPLVTAQLPGARVQFAVAPVAPLSGCSISIRKFRPLFGLDDLLRFGAVSDEMLAFLSDAVTARCNILVSGGTGAGKTTLINALSEFIPDNERVVTIEEALELSLSNQHVESLVTKELASGDDTLVIGQEQLLRASLRFRPDRIIVGEIRDGAGCEVMLQAANTGHDGTATTVHANSPAQALERLASLLCSKNGTISEPVAMKEVTQAFDVVVQAVRKRGRRYVSDISLVTNTDSGHGYVHQLFAGSFSKGAPRPVFRRTGGVGADTDIAERFEDAGIDYKRWGNQ